MMLGMQNILLFSLIIMRISGFILFNPILGRKNVPGLVRGGIIIVLSMILLTVKQYPAVEAQTAIEYAVLLLKEFFIGYILGFVVNLFLYIVILAGEIIDYQLGLAMAKIYDVQSNSSLALSTTYYNIFFILLFFVSDAHLAMLQMLLNSGDILPYGSIAITTEVSTAVLQIFSDCTVFAVKMAMPILAAEIFLEIGVGILMKTIPQINVFIVNIQAKLILGLVLMLLMFTPIAEFLENCIAMMFDALQQLMQLF